MQKYNLQKSPRGSKADLSGQTLKFIFLWKRKEKGNCYKGLFKYIIHNTMLKKVGQNKGKKNLDNFYSAEKKRKEGENN